MREYYELYNLISVIDLLVVSPLLNYFDNLNKQFVILNEREKVTKELRRKWFSIVQLVVNPLKMSRLMRLIDCCTRIRLHYFRFSVFYTDELIFNALFVYPAYSTSVEIYLLTRTFDLHSRDGDVHYKPSRSSTDLLLRTLIRDGKGTERVHQLAVRSGKAS